MSPVDIVCPRFEAQGYRLRGQEKYCLGELLSPSPSLQPRLTVPVGWHASEVNRLEDRWWWGNEVEEQVEEERYSVSG